MSLRFRLALAATAALFAGGVAVLSPVWAASPKPSKAKAAIEAALPLDVRVDEALTVPLKAPAASVFIANPEVADIQVSSPTSVMVFGKKTGETTLIAADEDGHTILHKAVHVTQDLGDLRRALRAVMPGSRVDAEAVPGGIVLTGSVKDAAAAEDARRLAMRYINSKDGEVINRLKVRGNNQIHIRVRFAEVSRDVDKRLGIDWESIGNVGSFAFGLASGETVISGGANLLNRARPVTDNATNDVLSFGGHNKHFNVNGMIDALAKDGLVTILAEPNLTAMSGETASFLAGGEFPVPVPQNQNTVTIEWKQYGVSLAFTPTLIGDNRINLHVRPEVSQLTESGSIVLDSITIPALTTRRAETTIELGSGQSFAIAGLLNSNQSESISKFPFLGDVPVLGSLFRSSRFQNNQSELVIVITPYIVTPVTQEQIALPMDGHAPPTDTEILVNERYSNADPAARPLSGAPRAVLDEAPTPAPAPAAPVDQAPSLPPMEDKAAERAALAPLPAPARRVPSKLPSQDGPLPLPPASALPASAQPAAAAGGPGGYILE